MDAPGENETSWTAHPQIMAELMAVTGLDEAHLARGVLAFSACHAQISCLTRCLQIANPICATPGEDCGGLILKHLAWQ